MNKTFAFTKQYTKQNVPPLRSGDTIRVHERITERDKERIQVFEGLVIATKHGTVGPNATFTVRKISHGVGVEKTFPLHSPTIQKIEIVKHDKVRRAKLYYLRDLHKKKKKKKPSKMLGMVYEEAVEPAESPEGIQAGPPQSSEAGLGGEPESEGAEKSPEQSAEKTQEAQSQESPKEEPAQSSPQEDNEADKKTE